MYVILLVHWAVVNDSFNSTSYRQATIAWMVGALLTFVAGSRFEDVIKHVAVPLPPAEVAAAAFVSFFSMIGQGLAAAVALFSVYALSVSLQKQNSEQETVPPRPPLALLLVRSQYPCMVLGSVALIAVMVAYMLKQGTDVRHFYLLGMSLLGLAVMFVIGTVAFAVVLGPSAKASQKQQQQPKLGIRMGVCLLQASGACATICCLTALLSYGLSIFR